MPEDLNRHMIDRYKHRLGMYACVAPDSVSVGSFESAERAAKALANATMPHEKVHYVVQIVALVSPPTDLLPGKIEYMPTAGDLDGATRSDERDRAPAGGQMAQVQAPQGLSPGS